MRVWIDTDIGSDVDDALALAYVARHPDLELVGISTVFGDIALRTDIAERLLRIADQDVPVIGGLGVPLTPGKRGVMFGHEGLGLVPDAAPVLRVRSEDGVESTVEAMASAITDAAPDVILAIGPLTNVGALVQGGAALPKLAIMGGKLTDDLLPGMVPEIPEWNWFCDPVGAQLALGGEHRETPLVVPAEVTFRTQLAEGDVETLAGGDELAAMLATLCGHWLDLLRDRFGRPDPRVALHDPLTAAVLVDDSLCKISPRRITIDDNAAATIHDSAGSLGSMVDAAIDVDPDAVRNHLMAHWLGRR